MKFIKTDTVIRVQTHTDDYGFTEDNTYYFPNIEEVENFVYNSETYPLDKYTVGIDINGEEQTLGCSESIISVTEQTDYKIDHELK